MSDFDNLCCCCAITAGITLLILLVSSISSLEVNEYGLDYSAITKSINPQPVTAGIHFLGVGHHFIKFPMTVQTIEFSHERTANSGPLKSRTSDGLEVTLEISFQYKLIYDKVFELYMKFGENYQPIFERVAIDILTDLATSYTAYDFFVDRTRIGTAMQANLNTQFGSACFSSIDFFQLRSVDLPDKFEDAIQLSEVKKQDILKAYAEKNRTVIELDTQKIEADYQKNVTINLASGEAQAILEQNRADVDSFILVQQAQSKSYQALKSNLKFNPDQLMGFIKSKLIRDYKPSALTVSITGLEKAPAAPAA